MKRGVAAFTMVVVLAAIGGCKPTPTEAPKPLDIQALRERAVASFTSAVMVKPDRLDSDQPAFELAPIFMFEVGATDDAAQVGNIATLGVAWEEGVLAGVDRTQVLYSWTGGSVDNGATAQTHVLRMTLDNDRAPVIWEIWTSAGEPATLFVAKSLEESAASEFGAPLPGRQFAIERDDSDGEAIVVRVIEDGPQAMGPFVYVAAQHQTVTTVICRCMPSQVEDILQTGYYRLGQTTETAVIRNVMADPDWLSRVLRLPAAF